MTRRLRLGELLAAVVGLALHRQYLTSPDETIAERISELRRSLTYLEDPAQPFIEISEFQPLAGYSEWAGTYDDVPNSMFEFEQPVVWSIFEQLRIGRALDAACGTGRHAAHLASLGHEVAGFDQSAEMLAVARKKLPSADLRVAKLSDIPWPDACFDLAVCSLALTHVDHLKPAIGELARVVQPGGRIILSDIHPFGKLLDYHAFFLRLNETNGLIRNSYHSHSDYIDAFSETGLKIRACFEPVVGPKSGPLAGVAALHLPVATAQAYLGIPMALIWELDRF